jgi:hypothetical protein
MATEAPSTSSAVAPVHAVDQAVMPALVQFAMRHHDRASVPEFQSRAWLEGTTPLLNAWLVFHRPFPGGRVVERFLQQSPELSERTRAWLEAQAAARLSMWKVTGVNPGTSFQAEDVFTSERRQVREASASRLMTPGLYILARLVDFEGDTVIATMHPSPLTPLPASQVRQVADSDPWGLLVAWEEAVVQTSTRTPQAPHNTDDDPIELILLEFSVFDNWLDPLKEQVPADMELVETASGGAVLQKREPPHYTVAHLQRRKRKLAVQVNSRRRADLVTRLFEAASMPLQREAPLDFREYQRTMQASSPPPPPDAVAAFKAQRYESWMDEPVPALGGQTPRQAVATVEGRPRVEALLEEMAFYESRLPEAQRYDFNRLRERLIPAL